MARCRAQYYAEIDIVEHIMQFREVQAEFAQKMQSSCVDQNAVKRARTRALLDVSLETSDLKDKVSSEQSKRHLGHTKSLKASKNRVEPIELTTQKLGFQKSVTFNRKDTPLMESSDFYSSEEKSNSVL